MDAPRPSSGSLGTGRAVGYGVADFGFNLFYTGLSLYLLYYYTDVAGLAPALAGLVFGVAVLWDGMTDPVMGWLATRYRRRTRGFRPYLLFGAPLLALSFVGMFAAPILFPGALFAACLISHLLMRTAYTLVSIPYSALSSVVTTDSRDRGKLAGWRMIFAILGGLATAALTLELAKALGGADLAGGFLKVAVIYGVVGTLLMWITFASTRETPELAEVEVPSLHATIGMLRENGAFWTLFAAIFALSVGAGVAGKAMTYYVQYVVGEPDSISAVLAAGLLAAALAMPLWMYLSTRLDKRTVWMLGVGLYATFQTALLVLAPTTLGPLIALHVGASLGFGAFAVSLWAMLPDTVEYGDYTSGVRNEGVLFGINQAALKSASALGVTLLGFGLGAVGYAAGDVQSQTTLDGLRWLTFAPPLVGGLLSLAVISRYRIGHARHREIVSALRARSRSTAI